MIFMLDDYESGVLQTVEHRLALLRLGLLVRGLGNRPRLALVDDDAIPQETLEHLNLPKHLDCFLERKRVIFLHHTAFSGLGASLDHDLLRHLYHLLSTSNLRAQHNSVDNWRRKNFIH